MSGRGRLALVTGGAGFIGSHVVEELARHGWRVRVLDDFSTGREQNLRRVVGKVETGEVEILRADLCDEAALLEALRGAELVFHEAAIASIPRSIEAPLDCERVNVGGTLQLLRAACRQGCRRLVFASSAAVYGQSESASVDESQRPHPLSPYAVQKLACEHYLTVYHRLQGLETVVLRHFNVYGARQDPHSDGAAVVSRFIHAALAGEPLVIYGDGEQSRDFVHVADVARAQRLAADAPGVGGSCFNLGSGRPTRLNDLVRALERVLGRSLDVRREPVRNGDVRNSVADVRAARDKLHFEPEVDLESGIRHTIEAIAQDKSPAPIGEVSQ